MISLTIFCDVCEKPMIPDEDGIVQTRVTKEWNTKDLFPHLCKNCAGKLDKAMAKVKCEISYQQAILASNKKINAERKEKLNTKG